MREIFFERMKNNENSIESLDFRREPAREPGCSGGLLAVNYRKHSLVQIEYFTEKKLFWGNLTTDKIFYKLNVLRKKCFSKK